MAEAIGLGVTVNPARAGMILGRATSPETAVGKPRASGDDPGITHDVRLATV